jgi:hypothetical protein
MGKKRAARHLKKVHRKQRVATAMTAIPSEWITDISTACVKFKERHGRSPDTLVMPVALAKELHLDNSSRVMDMQVDVSLSDVPLVSHESMSDCVVVERWSA